MSENLYAFSDESGNTGNHIFDGAQPYFWIGTLFCFANIDLETQGKVEHWKKKVCVEELHGAELGLDGIEMIADELKEFIDYYNLYFSFIRIEKQHLAGTKFVDTLLDSGINKAVSWLHYGTKVLQLPLALYIIENLTLHDRVTFWNAYKKGDGEVFRGILGNLAWRIKHHVKDKRAQELLIDAILWALDNPHPLLEATLSELDAPNMVAFSLLLDGVHKIHEETGLRVAKFKFDEQSQFGKSMEEMFNILYRIKFQDSLLAPLPKSKEIETFKCPIEFISSKSSVCLQVIDVILWLVKRTLENPYNNYPKHKALIGTIVDKSIVDDFSREQLETDVSSGLEILFNLKIPEDQMIQGAEILNQIEGARVQRMKSAISN